MRSTSVDPPLSNDSYKWRAFTAIAISFVTNVASMSMVFVALSAIADDFGVTLRAVSWVVIAQALTISALMLPMGRLADMVGRKKIHLSGLVLFAGGALFVAFAPTFGLLIVARVVMAVGNSMGQSVGTAMVVSVFPEHERGKAIGAQTTAVAIGGASGPIIAGLVLQVLPWQALFIGLTIPIGIAFVAALILLDEDKVTPPVEGDSPPFDWGGALLSALAVIVMVIAINNPFDVAWVSVPMVAALVVLVVLVASYIRWELRIPHPMLQLRLFQLAGFRLAVAARLLGFMGTTVSQFLVPIYLISLRGMGTAAAGAVLFLRSAGMGIAAQFSGRLSDRLGTRPFGIAGFVLLVLTVIATIFFTAATPLWIVMTILFISGLSHGLWNVPNNSTIIGSVPVSSYGVIGAFTNLTRNVASVLGQAVASTVVVAVMVSRGFDVPLSEVAQTEGAGLAFIAGWKAAFIVALVFSAVGLVLTALTRESHEDDSPSRSSRASS